MHTLESGIYILGSKMYISSVGIYISVAEMYILESGMYILESKMYISSAGIHISGAERYTLGDGIYIFAKGVMIFINDEVLILSQLIIQSFKSIL